ncbi:MAG TPA: protein phosphatase 2C domain-containing protein [Mycobacteriales bacterium]|nr:protein phosphatase 2C domain-containing protein [Mycobacteriales bacterium]
MRLSYAARSHAGLLRSMNEDSVYAGPRLLAVADGMGGHAAGEVASAVAIATLAPLDEDVPGADLTGALRTSARTANAHLRDMVAGDPELAGMGTTLVALLFSGNRLGMLHIGDSRIYLLRDGELTQVTHDHTFVQTLIDSGRISEEEAATHPQRSVITKVLDGHDDLEPDVSVREARVGDRWLLCSDGLTGPVSSLDTLRETLLIEDPQEACDRLVQLALRGGGPDNVTVVVADVVDDGKPEAIPVVAGAASDSPQEPPPGIADSAASRARAAEGREPPPAPPRATAAAPRRRRRTALALGTLLVLALLGALATWSYVRSQYYVGIDAEQVVVFRGVKGSVAGVDLQSVQERSTLGVSRLTEVERSTLEDGIVANDARDARAIVERLIEAACPTTAPKPRVSASPTAVPSAPPRPTRTPVPRSTAGVVPAAPSAAVPSPTPCP